MPATSCRFWCFSPSSERPAGAGPSRGKSSFRSLVLGTIPLSDPLALLERLFAGHLPQGAALTGAVIVFVLYAVLGSRTFCGWVCPMDTIEFFEPGRSWTDEDARRAKSAYEKTAARRAARQAQIDAELERRRQTTRKGLVADILAQVRKSGRSAS